jgi:hypothetical protein
MLPNSAVKTENLHEALDGDQPMQFHYVRCMSYLSNLSWESSPWCRLGILAPFRLRQVRLRSTTCATSTFRVGTPTLRQEREMAAGCGTPIRGPWAGLETCELPPVGGGRALWPCSGRARKRPGAGAGRAHHGPSGACAGRGRPRPGAGRGRDGHERSSGAAGSEVSGRHSGGIRPPYPGRRLYQKRHQFKLVKFELGGAGRARARRADEARVVRSQRARGPRRRGWGCKYGERGC